MQPASFHARFLFGALLLGAASVPWAQPVVKNGVLTDKAGITLYVFDNDATVPGRSACTGACLNMWTPLYADTGAKAHGDHQLMPREDGKLQWTYKGKPLYKWNDDKKPGDKGGDGLRKVWHVAVP